MTRLVFLPRAPDAPLRLGVSPGPAILVAPGEDVLCRWLELPARRDVQAVAAAAFLLEDELAAPRDQLHIALGAPEPDGTRLAVVVDRDRMQAWLAWAAAAGIIPEAVVPDCLLVPPPDEGVRAVRLDGTYAVRGLRTAFACEADLLDTLIPGGPVERVEGPAEVERLLATGAAALPVDLRQGVFAPQAAGEGPKWLALALAGILVASFVALPAMRWARAELAELDALTRVAKLAGPAGPGEPRMAMDRLRARADRLRAAERFPATAAAVYAAVESVEGMQMQLLVYGQDGTMRATVRHPNYSDVEGMRRQLARAGLTVREEGAAPDGGWIVSDLVVRPAS